MHMHAPVPAPPGACSQAKAGLLRSSCSTRGVRPTPFCPADGAWNSCVPPTRSQDGPGGTGPRTPGRPAGEEGPPLVPRRDGPRATLIVCPPSVRTPCACPPSVRARMCMCTRVRMVWGWCAGIRAHACVRLGVRIGRAKERVLCARV